MQAEHSAPDRFYRLRLRFLYPVRLLMLDKGFNIVTREQPGIRNRQEKVSISEQEQPYWCLNPHCGQGTRNSFGHVPRGDGQLKSVQIYRTEPLPAKTTYYSVITWRIGPVEVIADRIFLFSDDP